MPKECGYFNQNNFYRLLTVLGYIDRAESARLVRGQRYVFGLFVL
ncbi:hypothetical protein AF72_03295 [Xylella taiwanensis]|uniref:Uncharacterized protein n=1 Tax=Xylella taiwanensis TaxID=1444770 RepID=Z9JME0_9GAMM|nr:hypothetical protein AF72_03295 [Xylella taiwanensis]